jgi:predicted ATPase
MEEIPSLCLAPRFVPETLQRNTPINQKRDILAETGSGLAGLLADWKLEDDPRLTRVIEQLSKVVPQVREIRTKRTERGEYALWFGVGPQRKAVPAHEMSSGTLYALALLTLLESVEERSALILLDDLDRDLHPEAQGILLGHLRAVLEIRPGLQIVATSHSPYLVDHFLASEVRVMALDDEGFACIAPLTSHPDHPRLGSAMRPGEFWSAVGERWILRSTPEKAT